MVWHYLLTSYSWNFSGNFRQGVKAGSNLKFRFKVSYGLQAFLMWWPYLNKVRFLT